MTVVVPEDYHAKEALQKRNISCITREQALKQDIRALRIGILNIMPQAETYEYNLLFPLGRTLIQIEPVWIRLNTHLYKSTSHSHLDNLYVSMEKATEEKHLDGLIITGAPVEEIAFEEVSYWKEITEIMSFARDNIASTLGICWGGLALAKYIGIEKMRYEKKLFGIYEIKNIARDHEVTGELDDVFLCPQSRHSGIHDDVLEKEQEKGNINLLAHAPETGYVIFESSDKNFIMHLGHPEYNSQRLIKEYTRDKAKGRADVEEPVNFNVENPVNRWRSHSLEFFGQWIRYAYQKTPY